VRTVGVKPPRFSSPRNTDRTTAAAGTLVPFSRRTCGRSLETAGLQTCLFEVKSFGWSGLIVVVASPDRYSCWS